jgi:hypothetical protein
MAFFLRFSAIYRDFFRFYQNQITYQNIKPKKGIMITRILLISIASSMLVFRLLAVNKPNIIFILTQLNPASDKPPGDGIESVKRGQKKGWQL